MKTLYDLLGALPEDDADRLRAAFRKAAKANHPDNNPDDPDAPQRFRQIVRAHGILGDERQRATYDWLLARGVVFADKAPDAFGGTSVGDTDRSSIAALLSKTL